MSLSMGIVGLPNVGKSTLFNALTEQSVPAENYPFCTIDPSVGVVGVPDERLQKLSTFSGSSNTIPPAMEFVDIAGLVAGAASGEGLGNQFLSHIREVDAIAEVVRLYEDDNLLHSHGKVDPMHDIGVINLELILADLETVAKRQKSIEREVKRGDSDAKHEKAVLDKLEPVLADGHVAQSVSLDAEERNIARHLHLLTLKPILYVLNKQSGGTNLDETQDERFAELQSFLNESGASYLALDAQSEQEMVGMPAEEKEEMRQELGMGEHAGLPAFIQKSYEMLGLITFFTTGPDETRGWTIQNGATAPEAGAAIHSDFKDKFIRAQVIHWNELLNAGSMAAAREQGLIRTEGKDYVVKDGDVIEFKI